MTKIIKSLVKNIIKVVVTVLQRTRVGRYFFDQVVNATMSSTRSICHQGCDLTFSVPNSINHFRIDTFSTKEPETLEWIDDIPQGSVVWDIGANVGLYTCYAAKARVCRVFSFEPSVFNLELLARNIFLNDLSDRATIVPLPLSEDLTISTLNMTTTEWGGALSTFAQSYGDDGRPLRKTFEFKTVGLSMVNVVEFIKIPQPEYIKIDVDGIEHLILKGGGAVLKNVKSVLIEINEDFEQQTVDSAQYLSEAGLLLKEKRHSDMFENSVRFGNTYNQIWQRPG